LKECNRVEYLAKADFLDESGKPLGPHIQRVLRDLIPKFERRFPSLKDAAVITDVLEEAGRKISAHEQRSGPIEKLHGYAWVTVRTVALSKLRRSSMRVDRATVRSDESHAILSRVPSEFGTAEGIERAILFEEILARLSPDERMVCVWKRAGFSSKEIAERLDSSIGAVDILFYRVKEKIQRAVQGGPQKRPVLKARLRSDDESTGKANG
jgi:RNA polymerase sigma factor (sigma-70 family)